MKLGHLQTPEWLIIITGIQVSELCTDFIGLLFDNVPMKFRNTLNLRANECYYFFGLQLVDNLPKMLYIAWIIGVAEIYAKNYHINGWPMKRHFVLSLSRPTTFGGRQSCETSSFRNQLRRVTKQLIFSRAFSAEPYRCLLNVQNFATLQSQTKGRLLCIYKEFTYQT